MNVERLALPDVILVTPIKRGDARGTFHEAWHEQRYRAAGLPATWKQDNVSRSHHGVLRGLHLQHPRPQGKLVSVLAGEVVDVAVDVRRGSPTFGRWVSAVLNQENARQLFVPEGFAHGFVVTSAEAVVLYKCTDVYVPECERTIAWNDPAIGIDWEVEAPILSERDAQARRLGDFGEEELPRLSGTV